MLLWIFGEVDGYNVEVNNDVLARGSLTLERADISWNLSIDRENLPDDCTDTTFRSITIDGDEIEFSGGFTMLNRLLS